MSVQRKFTILGIYKRDTIRTCKEIDSKTGHLHLLGETIETCVQQTICSEVLLKVFTAASWDERLKGIQKSSDVVRDQVVILVNFAMFCLLTKKSNPSFHFHT